MPPGDSHHSFQRPFEASELGGRLRAADYFDSAAGSLRSPRGRRWGIGKAGQWDGNETRLGGGLAVGGRRAGDWQAQSVCSEWNPVLNKGGLVEPSWRAPFQLTIVWQPIRFPHLSLARRIGEADSSGRPTLAARSPPSQRPQVSALLSPSGHCCPAAGNNRLGPHSLALVCGAPPWCSWALVRAISLLPRAPPRRRVQWSARWRLGRSLAGRPAG